MGAWITKPVGKLEQAWRSGRVTDDQGGTDRDYTTELDLELSDDSGHSFHVFVSHMYYAPPDPEWNRRI